ncbi:MAG: trypco2 family protein [Bacteroidota bacterium]
MELNELIGYTLEEIETARSKFYENKKNYKIDEVNLEINVSEFEKVGGGIKVVIFNGTIGAGTTNTHKVTIKLRPNHRFPNPEITTLRKQIRELEDEIKKSKEI